MCTSFGVLIKSDESWCLSVEMPVVSSLENCTALRLFVCCLQWFVPYMCHLFLLESAGVIENVSVCCAFFSQASLLKRQYCLTTSIMLWNRQQVWGCVWLHVAYLWESLSDFTQTSFLNNVSFSIFFLFSWGGGHNSSQLLLITEGTGRHVGSLFVLSDFWGSMA